MKATVVAVALLGLTMGNGTPARAQSPEMPVPQMVLKDADGKAIAPIVGLEGDSG